MKRSAAFVVGVDEGTDRAIKSGTLVKVPRRLAWRVMIPKKISTMFIQDTPVGEVHGDTRVLGQPGRWDYRITVLAPNFVSFVQALQPESEYDDEG